MPNNLQNLFPVLRTRQELLREIQTHSHLFTQFQGWSPDQQEEFLDFCTGAKGVKMLYDSFFKEIMNPETTPERLEAFKKVYTIILFEKSTKEFHEFPNIYVHHSEQKSDTGLKHRKTGSIPSKIPLILSRVRLMLNKMKSLSRTMILCKKTSNFKNNN